MKEIITYIQSVVGFDFVVKPLSHSLKEKLPLYLLEGYEWYKAVLDNRTCILAQNKETSSFSIAQMGKHFNQIKSILGLPVIVVFNNLEAYNRKRLITKKIAFIVPNKQLYIPDFLIDLREYGLNTPFKQTTLNPIAQQITLLYILNEDFNKKYESKSLQELAKILDTTPMGITRAVSNLKQFELIDIVGGKEKYIRFKLDKQELWNDLLKKDLLINPVLKRIYVNLKPKQVTMPFCNISALSEYSNINPDHKEYYALWKNTYYEIKDSIEFDIESGDEGEYCLEVWKYKPETISQDFTNYGPMVDPISLYISMKDIQDERIQMALEQMISQFI